MRDLSDAAILSTIPAQPAVRVADERAKWQADPAHQHLAVEGQGLVERPPNAA